MRKTLISLSLNLEDSQISCRKFNPWFSWKFVFKWDFSYLSIQIPKMCKKWQKLSQSAGNRCVEKVYISWQYNSRYPKSYQFAKKNPPPREKYGFFTVFELPISQRVFVEWKGSRYEKYSKFFELFENFWKKGLAHPHVSYTYMWIPTNTAQNIAVSPSSIFQNLNEIMYVDKG